MKDKGTEKYFFSIAFRYLILLSLGLSGLSVFYFIFSPLTIYLVYFVLDLFFNTFLVGNTLFFSGQLPVSIIGACVAGSAYYLLTILNLSTPEIKLKTRILALGFSFLFFWILNSIRIIILTILHIFDSSFFDVTHILFWYIFSIAFVVGIWFFEVKLFKIKSIPLYSDLKFLYMSSIKKSS